MNIVDKTVRKLDTWQRRRRLPAFAFAVIKKYGEDEAGYQAALLTYYAFLAMFPLLLIATTLATIVSGNHSELDNTVTNSVSNYFPVLGRQLSAHVSTLHQNGPALFIGILVAFYGTRGVADAFRHGVQKLWGIPKSEWDGFPESWFKSFQLIIYGGLGFILASIMAGLAGSAGHGLLFRLLSVVVNVLILILLFTVLLNLSLPRHVTIREIRPGAITAALGLVIFQTLGSFLVAHELKHLDALYSYFAISLGLLFWIYLQAQVLFYAVEIAVVSTQVRWPRSLSGHDLTPADMRARPYLERESQK
jgi:YihY family inner membrane protein